MVLQYLDDAQVIVDDEDPSPRRIRPSHAAIIAHRKTRSAGFNGPATLASANHSDRDRERGGARGIGVGTLGKPNPKTRRQQRPSGLAGFFQARDTGA